jgi:hypothetical protein
MSHFQSDEEGETLRASEVKPKLERFLLKNLVETITWMHFTLKSGAPIEVEGEMMNLHNNKLISIIGENGVVLDKFSDYNLSVRARNQLDESGLSKNLWYEEIVLH